MSFFFDAFEDYYLKNKSILPDGEGGYITGWSDGVVVKASLNLGSANEIRVAQSQDLKTVFTITFPKNTPVKYGDYIEKISTGEIYRITSEPKDNVTPNTATYQTCFATAEKTELTQ